MSTYKTLDFKTIVDNADRKAKSKALALDMGRSGQAFNHFVKSSITFFYNEGSHSINIINDLLKMAVIGRGFNAAKLANYLKTVIPHDLTEGRESKKEAPKFGKKIGEYLTVEAVEAFIFKNKTWYTYGKDGKSTDFDMLKLVESVSKKLVKNNVSLVDFHTDVAKEMAAIAVKAIGK